ATKSDADVSSASLATPVLGGSASLPADRRLPWRGHPPHPRTAGGEPFAPRWAPRSGGAALDGQANKEVRWPVRSSAASTTRSRRRELRAWPALWPGGWAAACL